MYAFNIKNELFLSKLYVLIIYLIKTLLNASTEDRRQRAGTLGRKVLNAKKSDNYINKTVQEKKTNNKTKP